MKNGSEWGRRINGILVLSRIYPRLIVYAQLHAMYVHFIRQVIKLLDEHEICANMGLFRVGFMMLNVMDWIYDGQLDFSLCDKSSL